MTKLSAAIRPRLVVGKSSLTVSGGLATRLVTLMNAIQGPFQWGASNGAAMIDLYREVVCLHERGVITADLANVRVVGLSEYATPEGKSTGIAASELGAALLSPLGLPLSNCIMPFGDSGDPLTDGHPCRQFEKLLGRIGAVHVQVMELHVSGIYGLNLPGTPPGARARAVKLTEEAIADRAAGFGGAREKVPRWGWTSGPEFLLRAREVHVVAVGRNRAESLAAVFGEKRFNIGLPATVLHHHDNVTWWVDEAAAEGLDARTLDTAVRL